MRKVIALFMLLAMGSVTLTATMAPAHAGRGLGGGYEPGK